jgi:hypothetical protein
MFFSTHHTQVSAISRLIPLLNAPTTLMRILSEFDELISFFSRSACCHPAADASRGLWAILASQNQSNHTTSSSVPVVLYLSGFK